MTTGASADRHPPDPATSDPWAEAVLALLEAGGDGGDGGGGAASDLARAFVGRAPASYRAVTPPVDAALDARALASALLAETGGVTVPAPQAPFDGHLRFVARAASPGAARLRRLGRRPVELTALLPVLESTGLVVEAAVPHHVDLGPAGEAWIDDISAHLRAGTALPGAHLVEVLDAAVRGRIDVDPLNAIVATAGLTWRQVAVLRAYVRYWAQVPAVVPAADIQAALVAHPAAAGTLASYVAARFDPDGAPGAAAVARAAVVGALAEVPGLQEDRALRTCLSLVDATVRAEVRTAETAGYDAVVLKLDGAAIDGLPRPLPWRETWVHSPTFEGIHLRAGPVARGGLRWSERPDGLRTEVLDLMEAQVKKNAGIVPTGAKGGFVCRGDRRPGAAEVRSAYEHFVDALLAITDTISAGRVVHPARLVTHDGPDPYLVVAADRGTADLSDVANALSTSRGFWLGDAFAAGGSSGYNHKAMGITARGAWLAVRRHFHQLDVDVGHDPVRVAGVGDMSGDVFGNGMLLSDAILLVAAFDHRHVFLDPDPDAARSWAERRRLAHLGRSSWADYDPAAISRGGGVWRRDAKAVPLGPEARRVLGVDAAELSPPALVSAILEAPVDLLWFGGIGTFVKDAAESDAAIGDRANDEVRITADRLRARVVAEGGNLGVTQRARIRYSRRGGRINADFIDNAAGVATSDREVNCKILLSLAAERGGLAGRARDEVLAASEADVAADVLRQVDRTLSSLGRAVPESAAQLGAYTALMATLERTRGLDRAVESLPDDTELAVRREAGAGLIRPELAVLLAYATIDVAAAVERAGYVRSGALAVAAAGYWPAAVGAAAGDLAGQHRLYEEIVSTVVASEVVAHLGIVWAHETAAELGRPLGEVVAAYWAAREVVGAAEAWAALDEAWAAQPADAEEALRATVAAAVSDLARAYLRHGPVPAPGPLIDADAALAAGLAVAAPDLVDRLRGLGAAESLAVRCAVCAGRARVAEVGPVSRATGRPLADVLAALDGVGRAASLAPVVQALRDAPPGTRWSAWFRRATLDDLVRWRQRAAADVLGGGASTRGPAAPVGAPAPAAGPAPVAEQLGAWTAHNEVALRAAAELFAEVASAGEAAPTVAAVALRRLPDF